MNVTIVTLETEGDDYLNIKPSSKVIGVFESSHDACNFKREKHDEGFNWGPGGIGGVRSYYRILGTFPVIIDKKKCDKLSD